MQKNKDWKRRKLHQRVKCLKLASIYAWEKGFQRGAGGGGRKKGERKYTIYTPDSPNIFLLICSVPHCPVYIRDLESFLEHSSEDMVNFFLKKSAQSV